MVEWYVTSPRFTVWVKVDDKDQIIECAPVIRKFIGQTLQALMIWMKADASSVLK